MNNSTKLPPRRSIGWIDDKVCYIDQRLLPDTLTIIETKDWRDIVEAIKTLTVRGAPLIGISAAYGVALAAASTEMSGSCRAFLEDVIQTIADARPTAVNLFWALNRIRKVIETTQSDGDLPKNILSEAKAMHEDDQHRCEAMAESGQAVVPDKARILTVCNTGFLATGGDGTAAAVIYKAHDLGKAVQVFACETRPLLQGARLTIWEMKQAGIPATLLVDSAAAGLLAAGRIDLCIIGADRVASNGDVANKIGSYQLALACKAHDVPFYVAAPMTTIDPDCPDGSSIPIEERSADEVRKIKKVMITVEDTVVYNPAFDRVPAELIAGIITDTGIYRTPYNFTGI